MNAFVRTALAALLLGLVAESGASASDSCDQLRFQFATLSDDDEPTVETQKYTHAIDAQTQNLAALELTLRKAGCSSGSLMVIGGPNARECDHLGAKRDRMKRNLEILENKRASLVSESGGASRRQQIIDALAANRCNEEPQLVSTPGEDGTDPLVRDDPSGFETIRVPSDEPNYNGSQFVDLGGAATNGNLRTMCVRTCDGAYFPVSSHASPLNFQRDAQVCSMMCPGAETELYYHPLTSESSEMRSAVTGHPYSDLPTAYKFRLEKPGQTQCGCNFSLYYKEMMKRQSYVDDPDSIPKTESSIVWVKPALRPSLKKDVVAENAVRPRVRDYVPNDRIRVIGPKFLPDKRIDFTKPLSEMR